MADYPAHGGDLSWARRRFPGAPEPWVDLSTGINPWPYPVHFDPAVLARLPEAGDMAAARDAMAAHLGVSPGHIALAPGSEALIRLLARLRPAGTVDIVSPTYGGHADGWRAAGHEVRRVSALDQATADVVVAVCPNNPDGRRVDPAQILAQADRLRNRNGWLIVDRAFADLDSPPHLPADLPHPVICLHSFGKFFGLPGLRLGFARAAPPMVAAIEAGFGAWPIHGAALAVAAAAYADGEWIAATRQRLALAATRLEDLLAAAGVAGAGGTHLFRLVDHADAAGLFAHLGQAGIFTRIFDYNPRWLRIGLPGAEPDWRRLRAALADFAESRA